MNWWMHPYVLQLHATRSLCTKRSVKMTTEAAAGITGADRQDGYGLSQVAYHRRVQGE